MSFWLFVIFPFLSDDTSALSITFSSWQPFSASITSQEVYFQEHNLCYIMYNVPPCYALTTALNDYKSILHLCWLLEQYACIASSNKTIFFIFFISSAKKVKWLITVSTDLPKLQLWQHQHQPSQAQGVLCGKHWRAGKIEDRWSIPATRSASLMPDTNGSQGRRQINHGLVVIYSTAQAPDYQRMI